MQSESQKLFGGKYFMLVCRATEQAIRVEENNAINHEKSRLVGSKPNPQDNNQIFMAQKVGNYGTQYQIICCISDYVFEDNDNQILLKNGKQSKYQLFTIQPITATNLHTYYNIVSTYRQGQALSLQGTLRLSTLDSQSQSQQFRFEEVNNITIQNSCIIINNFCHRVIDVPEASQKSGERITIWDKNYRWNQRWYFQPVSNNVYMIKSIFNGLCLDIHGASKEPGAKVIQWPQNGGTNQLWTIQGCGDGLYRIWSVHQPSLRIGIRNQEGENGAYLEVTNLENATLYWKLQGAQPR